MSLIASWPLIDEAISFQSGPNSSAPFPYWCSVLGRTQGRWSSRRGRQYELDQVQAGTVTSTLRNLDAALDPSNTSSPFYPQVTPYRGYRRRAQLPATVNLLTADQATALYASKGAYTGSSLPQWVASITGSTISIGNRGSVNFYAVTVPASTDFESVGFSGFSITPGLAYSVQCEASCSSGVTAQIVLRFVDRNGNILTNTAGGSTTSSSGALIGVTATAPTNAAGGYLYVQNITAGASVGQFNVWNVQVEQNSTASAWVQPGTWYDIFTGFVERWPQSWTDGGTYGVSQLTCVDAIAYLSQRRLRSPAYMEILAASPSWLYPLDETQGSTFYDLTGTYPTMSIVGNWGGGTSQLSPGTTPPANAYGVSSCLALTNPDTLGTPTAGLNLGAAVGAGPSTSTAWTRVFTFSTPTSAPTVPYTIWTVGAPSTVGLATGSGNQIVLYIVNTGNADAGQLKFASIQAPSTVLLNQDVGPVCDGKMHVAAVSMNAANSAATLWLDGTLVGTFTGSMPTFGSGSYEYLGVLDDSYGMTGDLSCIAHFPTALSTAQIQLITSAILFAGSGSGTATSGTRYADVLRWAKWAGQSAIDTYTTGECNTYGPSVDLLASATEPGTDGVSAAQTVVDTDDGEQFVDRSGVVTFHARRWRFNQNTPAVTFGDGTGEIPYTDCSFGLDPTRLANDAAITQTSTQTTVTIVDSASVATYGDVQLQRNVNDTNTESLDDMAQYLATHYATPVQRLETLRIEPATYTVNGAPSTAAWQACLSLELGTPVAVNRRPPGLPTIGFTGFVEQINWTMDDQGRAVCELQVSPNYGKQFWQLDSSTFSVLGTTTICGY